MKRSIFIFLSIVSFFTTGLVVDLFSTDNPKQEGVAVSAILRHRPIGILGKPLGTRMVIEGTSAERVMLSNPLLIAKVDGQLLKVMIPFEIVGVKQLKSRVPYKLEGYETGGFIGTPTWVSSEVQMPFQYRSSFIVTKELSEPR